MKQKQDLLYLINRVQVKLNKLDEEDMQLLEQRYKYKKTLRELAQNTYNGKSTMSRKLDDILLKLNTFHWFTLFNRVLYVCIISSEGWRAFISELLEYSVSLSSDDADIDNEFKKYGFNIKSDIKNLKISPDDIDYIKEETLNIVVNEIMQKQHKYLIVSNSGCTVKVVKVRVADKTNKHGKRGGFRVISLVSVSERCVIIFSLIKKSNKSDLTITEKNNIRKMILGKEGGSTYNV